MGTIEIKIREDDNRRRTRQIILSTVIAAGLLPVALVAPNVIGALDKLRLIDRRSYRTQRVSRSLSSLLKNGLLEFRIKNDKKYLAITAKGKKTLSYWDSMDFKIEKPKKWDGKWRIIIFDIQERRRRVRDQIRFTLSRIGFHKLQQSVWVYPYDCEDLLMLLKADFEVGKNLLYIVADGVENDAPLRKLFELS